MALLSALVRQAIASAVTLCDLLGNPTPFRSHLKPERRKRPHQETTAPARLRILLDSS